ncbi:MAG: hypothetical protein L3J03_01015 [Desulfobacterales bacterium]|nr:hypothetical protein [Desulfobacterales bacterium]
MTPTSDLQPSGERIRQALCWVSDILAAYPEKKRRAVLKEAEIRFDLTPRECEFLNKEFPGAPGEIEADR